MRTLFARRLRAARSAAVLLMCAAMPVFGGIVQVEALLTPGQEVGPPDPVLSSTGTGVFSATYNDVTNLLSYTFSFEDLLGVTVPVGPMSVPSHIHRAPAGSNGPIVFHLDAPLDVTEASGLTGELTLTDENEADLLAGLYYVNVHTTARGAGEIRGQLAPIPEPGTVALMLSGLGALALLRLRRRS